MSALPVEAARLDEIRRLKREGLSIGEIVARLNGGAATSSVAPLRVTLDDIDHPAYMVNHNFEVVWINDGARQRLFGGVAELPPTSESRNLFRLLPAGREWMSLLRLHIGIAKPRVDAEGFAHACRSLDAASAARLKCAYAETEAEPPRPTLIAPLSLYDSAGAESRVTAYVSNYREGVFVALAPESETGDALLDLLGRRDEVIRSLLRRRLPVLTQMAVMVADLQGSVKICSELPPQEYFELINEIWNVSAPIYRKYHGTCGKHVGDGMLYYFFPQADSDYLMNALACAHEIRSVMRELSLRWQLRKNWFNELQLNTGITEGQEWLGTYQSSTGVEFVALGDTINQAARVSELARHGSIWATKSVIGKLPADQAGRVAFGVRRRAADGRELYVPSSFSQVQNLLEQDCRRLEKLSDIAALVVTEITEVRAAG